MLLKELKEKIDTLVSEGRGDLPVLHKASHSRVYVEITIYHITEDQAPREGMKLDKEFFMAPKGDHVLVDFVWKESKPKPEY